MALIEAWAEEHPQDGVAARALAAAYIDAGQLDRATQHHEQLLEAAPDDPGLLNNLAWLYHKSGDARAVTFAEKAQRLAPESPSSYDTLGWILVQQGEPARALRYLRQAHSRASTNPLVRHHLAVALHRLGRTEEARQELELALKTNQAFDGAADARLLLSTLAE